MARSDDISPNGAILVATLTCPHCQASQKVEMVEHACIQFHTCEHCGAKMRALDGACCVFCSYADIPCPDAQLSGKSCCYND